jgi:hypothetical protein
MGVQAIKAKVVHGFTDTTLKIQFRAINRWPGQEIPVIGKCIPKFRMGFDGLYVIRKVHTVIVYHIFHDSSDVFAGEETLDINGPKN